MGRILQEISATDAARIAGVTAQTIREWCKNGLVEGVQTGPRQIWRVSGQSLDAYLAERRRRPRFDPLDELQHTVARLTSAVDELRETGAPPAALVASLERERDRYRAEVAAVREAALRVNSASRQLYEAVSSMLEVMRQQSDALEQLLAPASPLDLMPHGSGQP